MKDKNFKNANKPNKQYRKTNSGKNRQNQYSNGRKRGKDFEVNIPDKAVNRADLPHVLSEGMNKDNDPQWYKNIPQVAESYGDLPYSSILGLPIPMSQNSSYTTTVPGIMAFDFVPVIGKASAPNDPVNIAAQQVYTLTRKANSGAINYDKTDLMMVVLAMDSAYMLYEDLIRAYKLLGSYNYTNRYQPLNLLRALGYSHEGLSKSMTDFKGILDLFAYQLGSINVPDQFDLIKRHSWMCTHIYKDSAQYKGQMYLFRPIYFYKWQEGATASEATQLTPIRRHTLFGLTASNKLVENLDQVQTAIDTLMSPILGSQDVGTISGDVAKAFGEGGLIKVATVDPTTGFTPVYSEEVMMEIENMDITGINQSSETSPSAITQVLTDVNAGPYLVQTVEGSTVDTIVPTAKFNMHKDSPSVDDNLVASRFKIARHRNLDVSTGTILDSYGTEIVTYAYMYTMDPVTQLLKSTGFTSVINFSYVTEPNQFYSILREVMALMTDWSKFDWAPRVTINLGIGSTATKVLDLWDYDNYYVASENVITDLNNV